MTRVGERIEGHDELPRRHQVPDHADPMKPAPPVTIARSNFPPSLILLAWAGLLPSDMPALAPDRIVLRDPLGPDT